MIPSCVALELTLIKCILIKCSVGIKFGHRRWLNSVADVQKEGERGDRKAAKMERMMFSHLTSKYPYFTRELPVRLGLVVFDNYSEHVTQIFSSFACLLMLTYFLNTENGHFCVFPKSENLMSSIPLYGHWWPLAIPCCARHFLFPCHNHLLSDIDTLCNTNCIPFLRLDDWFFWLFLWLINTALTYSEWSPEL